MNKKVIVLLAVLLFPSVLYIALTTGKHNLIYPPYYGPREAKTITVNGKSKTDTIYHKVPSFSFINQDGKTITDKDYEGKIYVADFFFATCQSICPKMATQLQRVQKKFAGNDSVLILSHTVDPEHDSVPVLKQYANMVHADTKQWNFVTGDKKQLYDIARHGYFITAMEGDGGAEDFIHSENFVLIDGNKHIRGIYDGTTMEGTDKLMDGIKALIAEAHARKEKR